MEVKYLLMKYSSQKVQVMYNDNPKPYLLPEIGPRPPFFDAPKYEPYFPII